MQLRTFQNDLKQQVYREWQTHRNVLAVLPTGGGKTAVFSNIISENQGTAIAIAHRQELVSQMSLSLANWGVRHRIVASDSVVREIVKLHHTELGKSFYDTSAPVAVASVDTLIRRQYDWYPRVSLWVVDEAHHLLKSNKWGEATTLFPNARGLGVTATPIRADGKGLGSHADGVFDAMVLGPTPRDLMAEGWLSDYDVYSIKPGDLDFEGVETGKTGDFKLNQLRKATHASRKLVGDVVATYRAKAAGKRGITFAVDIEQARQLTQEYNDAGVPAALVTAKTPLLQRSHTLRQFREGSLKQLVNVDLFGEGFDVPAVEVVSMARRTESYSLFSQQIGRMLRPVFLPGMDTSTPQARLAAMSLGGKPKGVLLDHVGNYISHTLRMGLPEDPKPWTLDAREKRASSAKDGLALTACEGCGKPYERFRPQCPHCGFKPTPAVRSTPEQVDGDLELLDRNVLKQISNEIARIDNPPHIPASIAGTPAEGGLRKKHAARIEAQKGLREAISQWGGWRKQEGLSDREAQRAFFLRFGVDVMTAQTLNTKDAEKLRVRVMADMGIEVQKPHIETVPERDARLRTEYLSLMNRAISENKRLREIVDDNMSTNVRNFVKNRPEDMELNEAWEAVPREVSPNRRNEYLELLNTVKAEGKLLFPYLNDKIKYTNIVAFVKRRPDDAELTKALNDVIDNSEGSLPSGVSLLPSGNYRARLRHKGSHTSLGTFNTIEEAEAAVLKAKEENTK